MERKEIILDGEPFIYWLRVSRRARRVSLVMEYDGRLVAVLPRNKKERLIEAFMYEKKKWIHKTVSNHKKKKSISFHYSGKRYKTHKDRTLALVKERVRCFNEVYRFSFNRVSVRNQKRQWGSCSAKKNLNFNFRLLFLPPRLLDYVVVHELCHLAELNHGKGFWRLVAQTMPQYHVLEKELKNYKI